MNYKIIGDSCLELTEELKNDPHFQIIPLTLQVGDTHVVDDETFDQASFLKLVKESPECPKTACPSPERFKEACTCPEENVFIVTLSSHLSGSYQSAMVGKQMYEEEYGNKNIFVVDSLSASSGELNTALFIRDLCEQNVPFEEITEQVTKFTEKLNTYFVLETLDFLRKNGRLVGLQAFFATALNIKPIMGTDGGIIVKLNQARGVNKALTCMCETAVKEAPDSENRRLIISHCNAPERAEAVKQEMLKRASFKEVVVTGTSGVATVYAADGGVILTL